MTTPTRLAGLAVLVAAAVSSCSFGAAGGSDDGDGAVIEAVGLPDGLCAGVDPEVVEEWDLVVDAEETADTDTGSSARCEMSGGPDGGTTELVVELETVGGADLADQQSAMDALVAERCEALETERGDEVEQAPVGGGCRFASVTSSRDAAEVVQVTPTAQRLGGVVRISMTRDGNQAQLLLPQVSILEAHFVLSEPDELLDPEA